MRLADERAAWISSLITTTTPRPRASGSRRPERASRFAGAVGADAAGSRIAPVNTTGELAVEQQVEGECGLLDRSVPWVTTTPSSEPARNGSAPRAGSRGRTRGGRPAPLEHSVRISATPPIPSPRRRGRPPRASGSLPSPSPVGVIAIVPPSEITRIAGLSGSGQPSLTPVRLKPRSRRRCGRPPRSRPGTPAGQGAPRRGVCWAGTRRRDRARERSRRGRRRRARCSRRRRDTW